MRDKEHPYYTPGLFECIHSVPVIGCEAAYLFPTDIDVCLSDTTRDGPEFAGRIHGDSSGTRRLEPGDDEEEGTEERDQGTAAADVKGVKGVTRTGNVALGRGGEGGDELATDEEGENWRGSGDDVEAAGNLVVHIRSGDIFVNPVHEGYGQVGIDFVLLLSRWSAGCVSPVFRAAPSRGMKPKMVAQFDIVTCILLCPLS